MNNEIDYSVRKGIRPTPKCEDYELCACDADGASHTLKVSFNESDQIVDAVIERVNNNVQLEWRGPEDGLPPVGTRVDIVDDESLHYGAGESGEVVAHVENTAVVRMSYGLGCFTAECLRPIRSEEDKAVEQMMESGAIGAFFGAGGGAINDAAFKALFKYMVLAGYRKQENLE